ncbi:MAG: hypothetical protein FJX75_00890 [Armatimonadetes bacterium]|nr:hypothetical protein [Armatimonadota bacterium]
MVNRELRDLLATWIEGFLRDPIDGPALGRGFRRFATASKEAGHPDPAVLAVVVRLWQEFPEYTLRGPVGEGAGLFPNVGSGSLSPASWNAFVRAALFLRSDREIEWPEEQWDPYDTAADPPDYLALALVLGATAVGFIALYLLICRQWTAGLVLAVIAAILAGLRSRVGDPRPKASVPPAGDPSAFPFLSQSEVVEELGRQGEPPVPFKPESPDGR